MIVCLLLAAGSSSRMGKPKMLLPYNDKTFLQHIVDEIKELNSVQLLVVTGSCHSLLQPILASKKIPLIENKKWEEGMGSSIRAGIEYIQSNYKNTEAVLILVCDQPFISSSLLNDLIETANQKGKGIIASAYSDTLGTPVLFNRKYFGQLLTLSGQSGAKRIIQQFDDDVASVEFPAGATDIDTPEDYKALP